MQQSMPSTVKLMGLAIVVSFATACAAYPPIAHAQSNVGTNIPVLVMGEDEDPTTVKRSSDIFKRVIAELQGAMQRYGFRMIDEESVAADLEWKISDRRPKRQLIETIKDMATSDKASHQVRAWVLFRIHAQAKQLDHAVQGDDPYRRRDLRCRLQSARRRVRDAARAVSGAARLPGIQNLHQRGRGRPRAGDRGGPG